MTALMFSDRILACLKTPGGDDATMIEAVEDGLKCAETGQEFPFIDGVPSLYQPLEGEGKDVTARVKSFYEENPFPNYEGLEEFGELVSKGSQNPFSANLLKAIGYNKTVLECGCGTGQLSHFLQLNNNHVLGIDMSLGSLKLALEHKQRNGLDRSSFTQMNIFELAIKDASFDVVISHGVLHHTFDAKRAFAAIARKVKPGGLIMVGLYNRYARIPTWVRSKVIGLTGGNIDYVVRNRILDSRKADIWIKDQYYNPHETWHSIDEVLAWFNQNGIEYQNCSPAILGTDGEDAPGLFDSTSPGNAYQRLVTQLSWIGTIAREGALFDVIGRKRA
ncbi:MAG: class I SAM-dependent methyltransferase [Rhodospirillales bacterium]|nr:class I SAM-dependent methyltransferase [Rhodospirillales bacterium]